jgi:hypothetical protein
MKFEPKTEEELAKARLIPDGVYDGEITAASDETSKTSGKEMIKVTVRVYAGDRQMAITDYIDCDQQEKLFVIAASAGLLEQYHSGELQAYDLIDRSVKVKVGMDKGNNGYPPKNTIRRYVVPKGPKPEPTGTGMSGRQVASLNKQLEEDDSVPF